MYWNYVTTKTFEQLTENENKRKPVHKTFRMRELKAEQRSREALDGTKLRHKYYFLCFLIKKTFIKILIAPSGIFFCFLLLFV